MKEKNYNWDEAFAAPMNADVPPALGGLRLDQALARLFPQYSRNRLQAWLKSGHITIDGKRLAANHAVTGGERIALRPPPVPDATPQAQRMPLKVAFEDAELIVIDKPAGLVVHPGAGGGRSAMRSPPVTAWLAARRLPSSVIWPDLSHACRRLREYWGKSRASA